MDFLKGQALNVVGLWLSQLLSLATPYLREELTLFLRELYAKARATPNGFDDALVGTLMAILSVPTTVPDALEVTGASEEQFHGIQNIAQGNV